MRLSESQGIFNLGQICQNSEAKILKANLPSSTRALLSDKARCFSQSERALYGNFIINYTTIQYNTIQNNAMQFKYLQAREMLK